VHVSNEVHIGLTYDTYCGLLRPGLEELRSQLTCFTPGLLYIDVQSGLPSVTIVCTVSSQNSLVSASSSSAVQVWSIDLIQLQTYYVTSHIDRCWLFYARLQSGRSLALVRPAVVL